MMFDELETKASYIFPVSEKYFGYLKKRKVISREYINTLKSGGVGILTENFILINDVPYSVNCLLGESKESIFDIIETNSLYGLSSEDGTAFAVLHGDDYLLFLPNDAGVYYKSISTDERVLLAKSFTLFLGMISFQNEGQKKSTEKTFKDDFIGEMRYK